jgi:16S rRNA (guanine(1405)-N(7))-methyltransferase
LDQDPLETLVATIKTSRKYRHLADPLIRRIGRRELLNRRKFNDAVKATKNKLHQVGGAYLELDMLYPRWTEHLRAAYSSGERDSLLAVCRAIMAKHSSTRERLPDLDGFYKTLFPYLGSVKTVLDLACGLNPLAIPWMPLAPNSTYYACDIYKDMVDFLNSFFPMTDVAGHAVLADLGEGAPSVRADVALLLKTLPCLEQVDKNRSLALLESVDARHLLVSYPSRSLGGRGKGMADNYEREFRELVAHTRWKLQRFEFSRELVFLVSK